MRLISLVCQVESVQTEVERMWMLLCICFIIEGSEGEVSSLDVVFTIRGFRDYGVMFLAVVLSYSTTFSTSWKARLFLMWTMKCTCFAFVMCLCSESTIVCVCLLMPGIITLCHLRETSHQCNYGLAGNTEHDIQLTQVKLVLAIFIQPCIIAVDHFI